MFENLQLRCFFISIVSCGDRVYQCIRYQYFICDLVDDDNSYLHMRKIISVKTHVLRMRIATDRAMEVRYDYSQSSNLAKRFKAAVKQKHRKTDRGVLCIQMRSSTAK